MAINRDAYKSLVESVNEAVSAPSVGASKGAARVRGGRTSSTASSKPTNLQWGSSAIGGAMNATELAQWLASQQGGGKQGPSVGVADTASGVAKGSAAKNLSSVSGQGGATTQRSASSSGSWGGSGVYGAKNAEDLARILNQMQNDGPSVSTGASKGGMKSRKNPLSNRKPGSTTTSSKPAPKMPTVSVADVQEALDILAEAQVELNEWPINIGGRTANNASELAQILNSMQNNKPSGSTPSVSKGVVGAAPKSNLLSNRRPGSTTGSKPAPKAPTVGASGVAAMSEDEEWDILDEILAEGLELYGEDGLAEILADFAETGEMSQELADLLDAE